MRLAPLALVLALLGLGCTPAARAPVPSEPCVRMGDPCRLPDGPLGVCSETTAPCEEPPCLACMSQH